MRRRNLLRHGHPMPLALPRRRQRRAEAMVWRAIVTGLGFGLTALTMMALVLGPGQV